MDVKMVFQGYDVLKLQFERLQQTEKRDGSTQLQPQFSQAIRENKENGDIYLLDLGVKIDQADFPIQIEVLLRGRFIVAGDDCDAMRMMKVNATAILFPYLRATLSMMTNLAGIPPIVLPTMNLVDAFLQSNNEQDAEMAE